MFPHDGVKGLTKKAHGTSPGTHLHQVQDRARAEHRRVKVIIMSNRVPPRHQLIEQLAPPAML
jgi:hypothetical protein